MFKNSLLPIPLMAMLFLSACGPAVLQAEGPQPFASPVDLQTQPSFSGPWSLSLTQSGGFAGVMLTVQVSSDGKLTAEDQRSGRSVTQTLPAGTLAKLAELTSSVASTASGAGPKPQKSSCRDCFLYDLQVTSAGRTARIQADDTTLGASGAQELIGLLRQLRDGALRGQP